MQPTLMKRGAMPITKLQCHKIAVIFRAAVPRAAATTATAEMLPGAHNHQGWH